MRQILGIQGTREAIRVRASELARVLVQDDGGPKLDALARYAEGRGVIVERVGKRELERQAAGGRHQGVIAFAPDLPLTRLDDLDIGPRTAITALDGIMDPQNFGALIRSSVALGAPTIVWPEHASAPLSPATFRASAGAIEHATLCRVASLPDAIGRLAERGVVSIALDAQAPVDLDELDLDRPVCIVVGAEDRGVRRTVRAACEHAARLPMNGPIGSLNASVAGALALYEVARQRPAIRDTDSTPNEVG